MLILPIHWLLFRMKSKSILEVSYIYHCTIIAYNTSIFPFWMNFEFHSFLNCCWPMGLEIYQTIVYQKNPKWCFSTKDITYCLAYQTNSWYVGLINNTRSQFSKCNFGGCIAIMKTQTLFYAFCALWKLAWQDAVTLLLTAQLPTVVIP